MRYQNRKLREGGLGTHSPIILRRLLLEDNRMVMTILEAHVSKENWAALEQAYNLGIQHRDAGLVQTFLIHSLKDNELWRILTTWESQEALDEMRRLGEIPRGVQIFRDANAEPVLSVFEIAQHLALE